MYDLTELHPSLSNIKVSEDGEVYNKKTGKKLKQYTKKIKGIDYLMVSIYNKEKKGSRPFYVHRLVGYAYCEGYSEDRVIEHIDGNKMNNHASNLQWISKKNQTIQLPNEYHSEIVHLDNGMTIMPTEEWDRMQKYIQILIRNIRYNNVKT